MGKLGIAGCDLYCNEAIVYINSKLDRIPQAYMYFILQSLNIEQYARGTIGNGNLNKEILSGLQIPVPKSPEKMAEWVAKISAPYDAMVGVQANIKALDADINCRITDIFNHEECDDIEFDDILEYVPKVNKYKASDGLAEGAYRFYTSSQEKMLYRDDYEFEDAHILIGRGGNVSIHLSSKFSVSHDDVYVLRLKKAGMVKPVSPILLGYVFHYLKVNISLISDSFKGSTIKHSSKGGLSKINIKVPKNKAAVSDISAIIKEIDGLENSARLSEDLYKKYIKELKLDSYTNTI
jgi:restriction endonuclease S subunit